MVETPYPENGVKKTTGTFWKVKLNISDQLRFKSPPVFWVVKNFDKNSNYMPAIRLILFMKSLWKIWCIHCNSVNTWLCFSLPRHLIHWKQGSKIFNCVISDPSLQNSSEKILRYFHLADNINLASGETLAIVDLFYHLIDERFLKAYQFERSSVLMDLWLLPTVES